MSENKCQEYAAYRYTWPGRNESYICEGHSHKMKAVANAIGLPLQLIPINAETEIAGLCEQVVSSSSKG